MKRLIRLTEGDLHRIVRNSVKRVLRENKRSTRRIGRRGLHESYSDEEDEIFMQNGIDPRLVSTLNSPEEIQLGSAYDDDSGRPQYTDEFGITADEDGDIRIYIGGEEHSENEDGWVVDLVKDMCRDLKRGKSPEKIWQGVSFDWSL